MSYPGIKYARNYSGIMTSTTFVLFTLGSHNPLQRRIKSCNLLIQISYILVNITLCYNFIFTINVFNTILKRIHNLLLTAINSAM